MHKNVKQEKGYEHKTMVHRVTWENNEAKCKIIVGGGITVGMSLEWKQCVFCKDEQSKCNPPIVGTVDKTSPMWSLQRMVVLPAASRPSMTTYGSQKKKEMGHVRSYEVELIIGIPFGIDIAAEKRRARKISRKKANNKVEFPNICQNKETLKLKHQNWDSYPEGQGQYHSIEVPKPRITEFLSNKITEKRK